MGGVQSRSHELVLKSAAGDLDGVRQLLQAYVHQRRLSPSDLALLPAAQRIDLCHALPEGDFALEMATSGGTHNHQLIVQMLLEHGADVNQQDANGLTALMCAVHERATALTLLLLQSGKANVDLQDTAGCTALHHAAKQGHSAQVVLLLSHHASLRLRDRDGHSPLDVACGEGQWEICKLMLAHLQAANQTTLDDTLGAFVQPVLLLAAQAAQWDVVQLALECGADSNAFLPSGGRIVDLLPSFVLGSLKSIAATRRADCLIHNLYPHLTSSTVELLLDYDAECYLLPGQSVSLPRLIAYLKAVEVEQDRKAAERKRDNMAEGVTSRSSLSPLSSDSGSRSAASPAGGGAPDPSPSPSASRLSVSGGVTSGTAVSSLAPPSQQSGATKSRSGTRLPPFKHDSHSPHSSISPAANASGLIPFSPDVAAAAAPEGMHFRFAAMPLSGGSDGGFIAGSAQAPEAADHLPLPPTLRSAIVQSAAADAHDGLGTDSSAFGSSLSPHSAEPRSGDGASSSGDDASASPLLVEMSPFQAATTGNDKEASRSGQRSRNEKTTAGVDATVAAASLD